MSQRNRFEASMAFVVPISPGLTLSRSSRRPAIAPVSARRGNEESPAVDKRSNRQIQDFLTQRSLQTLIYYLIHVRDHATYNFLEGFLGHKGISEYHGYHGLRLGWEEYITELVNTPSKTVTIRNPNFRRGGTPGNPHIKRYEDFEYVIDARHLGDRMLQIREHLASEFQEDLTFMRDENDDLRRKHRESVNKEAATEILLKYPAKEREIIHHANSPYREGTYDLLKKYSVYVALKRTLEKLSSDPKKKDTYKWLKTFFEKNGDKFDGDHGYFVGEDFINLLWEQIPILQKKRGGGVSVIDPDFIVNSILEERVKVAQDWIIALMSVPKENLRLRKVLLDSLIKE